MAKKLRYGKKTLPKTRTLALATPRTLATTTPRTLAERKAQVLFPSEKKAKGRELSIPTAQETSGRSTKGKAGSKKAGAKGSGGSAANRTDGDEETESAAEDRKPKGVVRSSVVVQMLESLGMSTEEAEAAVLESQLSQDNPRVNQSGASLSRRDSGTGFGSGNAGGSGKRSKRATPKQSAPQPAGGGGQRTLSLPASPGGGGKPLSLPASPSKPLALPSSKAGIVAKPQEALPTPPESFSGMKASGFTRFVEQVVRSLAQPPEKAQGAEAKRSQVMKKALLEGELGKAVDALVANRIEFEDETERQKTYSWLERMIRKIQ